MTTRLLKSVLLAAAFLGIYSPPVPAAPACALTKVTTWYNTIIAPPYKLQFDDHDPPGPHGFAFVWDDNPMPILSPDGRFCRANDDVAIVTSNIYIAARRYLYIETYDNSLGMELFVLDAPNCKTLWHTVWDHDEMTRSASGLFLPQLGNLEIGPDCLPKRIGGRPIAVQAPHP